MILKGRVWDRHDYENTTHRITAIAPNNDSINGLSTSSCNRTTFKNTLGIEGICYYHREKTQSRNYIITCSITATGNEHPMDKGNKV
jgi:hypothetical protein